MECYGYHKWSGSSWVNKLCTSRLATLAYFTPLRISSKHVWVFLSRHQSAETHRCTPPRGWLQGSWARALCRGELTDVRGAHNKKRWAITDQVLSVGWMKHFLLDSHAVWSCMHAYEQLGWPRFTESRSYNHCADNLHVQYSNIIIEKQSSLLWPHWPHATDSSPNTGQQWIPTW